MKKWESPRINVQEFVPNDYVSLCFDVTCNISGYVFQDKDGDG